MICIRCPSFIAARSLDDGQPGPIDSQPRNQTKHMNQNQTALTTKPTEWHGLTFTEDQFARTHADYVRRLFTGEMNSKEFFEAVYAETRNLLYIHRGTAIAAWVMQGIARTGKIPGHDGDLSNLKPSENERMDMQPSVLKSFDRPPVDSRTGIVTVGQLRKLCDQFDDADEVTAALTPMDKGIITAMKVPGGMRLMTLDMLGSIKIASEENQSARPPEVTQARPNPAIHDPHPEPKTEGTCKGCGQLILKVAGVWQHSDPRARNHIAEPLADLDTATCKLCNAEIFWNGLHWDHSPASSPSEHAKRTHDPKPETWA